MSKLINAIFIFLALAFCISGCAGGSKGTGVVDYVGKVFSPNGEALPGITITVVETGSSDVTDAQGQFSINSEAVFGDVELLIDTARFSKTTVIGSVPSTAKVVTVTIEVDEENENVSTKDFGVEEKEEENHDENSDNADNTPKPVKPTKTPVSSNNIPTPSPTAVVTVTPTASHTPEDGHDEDENDEEHQQEVETEGRITALNSNALTVKSVVYILNTNTSYVLENGQPGNFSMLAIGNSVNVKGVVVSGQNVATRVKLKD